MGDEKNFRRKNSKEGHRIRDKRYESIDFSNMNDRPITFGLVKKAEPLKTSTEYQEDRKLKNQVLDEISSLKRSQDNIMISSKEYSASGQVDAPKCSNHPNKKVFSWFYSGEI